MRCHLPIQPASPPKSRVCFLVSSSEPFKGSLLSVSLSQVEEERNGAEIVVLLAVDLHMGCSSENWFGSRIIKQAIC